MRYKLLADLYEELSSTTKRLEKTEILSKFLYHLTTEDKDVLYLLLGDIYPEYDERRIGISEQLAIKAISKSTGNSPDNIKNEWKKIGDLGEVAEKLISKKSQSTLQSHVLTTDKVLNNLRKLPALEGIGTVDKKLALITELLTSASPIEAKYLVRTLIGDLRIGIKESTIRESIAKAFFKYSDKQEEKEIALKIQDAIDKSNDVASVFEMSKKSKLKDLDTINLEVGKPIKAMLAQKAKNIEEGFKAVGKPAAIEYKYDGFRMIIHKNKEEVKLFTRSLENVTKQFPEVVEYILKNVKGNSFILDSEAVGYDAKTKVYQPFQNISQRIRRKYDIEQMQKKLPIEVNIFDILFYNGKSLLDQPFEKRSELIRKILTSQPYKIIPSKQIITSDEKKAKEFYNKALKDNQEGIMMKNLQAPYKPGRRVGNMLKIKPEEKDLDVVITGGEYGTGKRSGWISSFIISVYDSKNKKYLEVGKVGTGMKEKATNEEDDNEISFDELTKLVKPHIKKEKGKLVEINPKIVLSITYQEIQHSPNYNSGFALRFPRFTRLRPDRTPKDVTTLDELKKDFERQKRNWRYG